MKDIYHYFREDGSLAYVNSHLGTFYGEYTVEWRKYFDRNGRLISKREVFRPSHRKATKKGERGEMAEFPEEINY